jgi:outer membrane protein TolC
MKQILVASIVLWSFTSSLFAQSATTLPLTVDQAVSMALDNNVELSAERLNPQIGDTDVAAARGAFTPVFSSTAQRNSQLAPPSSFLVPTPTRTDVVTSEVALTHRIPRFGTSYSLAWDSSHTGSDSVLNSYNPLLQSGLSLNVSQPLARDFRVDAARQLLTLSRTNRTVSDIRLREALVHTTAGVKAAYWNLVSARAAVEARQAALDVAQELARLNKAKVDVGQSAPIDMVAAQAEVAANQEQLIIAETTVKQAEDRLRVLIFDPTMRDNWNVRIEPTDAPPVGTPSINVDAAIANALANRTDLDRARKDIDIAAINSIFAKNQQLPDVRVNGAYQSSGLGGTQVLRIGGFPGAVVGSGQATSYASVLGQLLGQDYRTWALGVSVSYPIGRSTEEANYARARLEQAQAQVRAKTAEGQAIQQIRSAAWNIEMNAKRIEASRAARELAEQRIDAERKRFEVGLSTSFLVIQAQRDLSQARTNELSAVLAYALALVEIEALQQAGPAGQTAGASAAPSVRSSAPTSAQQAAPQTMPATAGLSF